MSLPASAQPRGRTIGDEQIVKQARFVAGGELVDLYQDGMAVEPGFLVTLEDAYRKIEKLIGQPLDKASVGDKIRVYVSDAPMPSHVWHGYEHRNDPRGILFLNRVAFQGAQRGDNATYVHEMTHLFTWRFRSHTLREGLADYVALQILPGAAVGPNVKGYDWSGRLPDEVTALLGTTEPPPEWVNNEPQRRQAYYFGSYRFVKLLVDKGGLAKFMQLYAAADTEAAYLQLYGQSRAELLKSLE